jgi:RNA polymerase sigma-B factor
LSKRDLTQEQIDDLFREYKANSSLEVRDKLFHQFSHIPAIVARRFIGRGIEYEDIMQVAALSLLRAID